MILKFDTTEEDYLAFQEHFHRTSPALKQQLRIMIGVVVAGGFVLNFATALGAGMIPALIRGLIPAAFVLVCGLVFYQCMPKLARWLCKKAAREAVSAAELEVLPQGLRSKSKLGESIIYWDKIDDIQTTPEHTFIYTGKMRGVVIPQTRLRSRDYHTFMQEFADVYAHRSDAAMKYAVPSSFADFAHNAKVIEQEVEPVTHRHGEENKATLTYDVTEEDFVALQEHFRRTSPVLKQQARKMTMAGSVLVFFTLFVSGLKHGLVSALFGGLLGVLFTFLSVLVALRLNPLLNRILFKSGAKDVVGPVELELTSEGLRSKGRRGEISYYWENLGTITTTPTHTFIYVGKLEGIVIPQRRVLSGNAALFMQAFADEHAKRRNVASQLPDGTVLPVAITKLNDEEQTLLRAGQTQPW